MCPRPAFRSHLPAITAARTVLAAVLGSLIGAGRVARVLGAWRGNAVIPDTPAPGPPAAGKSRGWPWRRPRP